MPVARYKVVGGGGEGAENVKVRKIIHSSHWRRNQIRYLDVQMSVRFNYGSSCGDAPCYVFYVKHQALVYDILPSTSAIVDNAIGLEKLSANEQFFDDAQTAVSL